MACLLAFRYLSWPPMHAETPKYRRKSSEESASGIIFGFYGLSGPKILLIPEKLGDSQRPCQCILMEIFVACHASRESGLAAGPRSWTLRVNVAIGKVLCLEKDFVTLTVALLCRS